MQLAIIQKTNEMNEMNEMTEIRKEQFDRWYAKLKSDPVRWAERMDKQRKRRESKEIRERERNQERVAWAKLPKDHPRKKRKPKRKPDTIVARRKRANKNLCDGNISNRYLFMHVSECPKELIELKREHIKLTRKLRTITKTK
jgi:hypothetical protein